MEIVDKYNPRHQAEHRRPFQTARDRKRTRDFGARSERRRRTVRAARAGYRTQSVLGLRLARRREGKGRFRRMVFKFRAQGF